LERLAGLYNVNLNWLISGKGQLGVDGETAEIELYDQEAAAGRGREVADYIEKWYFSVPYDFVRSHRAENLKAVYVSGDSMTGERINEGDIVIFNVRQIEGNGIYVVSIGNSLLVKRVDFDNAKRAITLISANPAGIRAKNWKTSGSPAGLWRATTRCREMVKVNRRNICTAI